MKRHRDYFDENGSQDDGHGKSHVAVSGDVEKELSLLIIDPVEEVEGIEAEVKHFLRRNLIQKQGKLVRYRRKLVGGVGEKALECREAMVLSFD